MINEELCYEVNLPQQGEYKISFENHFALEDKVKNGANNLCDNPLTNREHPLDNTVKDKEGIFLDNFGPFFYKVAGEDEMIDSFELQNVLSMIFYKKANSQKFSLETSRCILASADSNRDGRLSYYEFKKLWFNIIKWKKFFEESDLNKDKMISKSELEISLKKLDINIEATSTDAIFSRYGNKQNLISMDDFIQILCKLSTVTRWVKEFDKKMTLDAFIKELLYC